MSAIIKFENVSKAFGRVEALQDITFDVKADFITGLIGNNGSGKSTSIHIICNIIGYDRGSVYIFDKRLSTKYISYKNRIGVMLTKETLIEGFTPVDYLKFVCRFQHVDKAAANARIEETINFLDIREYQVKIKDLSAGNRAKVKLAAALVHNPEILILDEPLANLDMGTAANVIDLLKGLRKTILLTSHNLEVIADLCDSYIVLSDGRKKEAFDKSNFQNPDELKAHVKNLLTPVAKRDGLKWLKS